MKYIIKILLVVCIFSSCKEQNNNELNASEIMSKKKESSPLDSVKHLLQKDTIDSLNKQKSITNMIELTLPTPDTTIFNSPATPLENIDLIEIYVKTYFIITQPAKVLESTSADNQEGLWDCHIRTEYGNIAMVEYTCDFQLEKTVEFKNYSLEEVKRVLKILYPEVEYKLWEENTYAYDSDGGYGCSLEVINENEKIMVFYGCST
jgi:hypothetical protein